MQHREQSAGTGALPGPAVSLCAENVRQREGEKSFDNLMEVKS